MPYSTFTLEDFFPDEYTGNTRKNNNSESYKNNNSYNKSNYNRRSEKKKRGFQGETRVGSSMSNENPAGPSGLYSWLIRYNKMSNHEKRIRDSDNLSKFWIAHEQSRGPVRQAEAYENAERYKAHASIENTKIKAEAYKHNSDNVYKSNKEKYESKRKSSFLRFLSNERSSYYKASSDVKRDKLKYKDNRHARKYSYKLYKKKK